MTRRLPIVFRCRQCGKKTTAPATFCSIACFDRYRKVEA